MYNQFRKQQHYVVLLALLLLLPACDDPSQIGIDLVDAQAGDTEVVTLPPSQLEFTGAADITGGTNTSSAFRSLFGKVSDPVAGDFAMEGYMDFVGSANVSSAFSASPISFADLELNLDYVYGDTTAEISVDIYDIEEAWSSSDARADAFLVARSLVTSASLEPTEGLIRIPLPEAWIASKDAVLRSGTFVDDFHGLAFKVSQGNTVLGVHFSGSSIRASSVPGDTVNFSMSKTLSASSFLNGSQNPAYHTLRDGAAETLSLKFPIEDQQFGSASIHRVIIRLNTEDVSDLYPSGFKRSGITRVGIRAVATDNETRLNVGTMDILEDGIVTFDSATLSNVVQSANLGNSGLDHFEIYFPAELSTVEMLAFKKGLPATFGPRAVITYTSLN
jgi:hypothetical protein